MMLTTDHFDNRSVTTRPVVSVYCQLLPVSAEVRGTTVPAAGIAAAGLGIRSNTTDMGAVAFVEGTWRESAGGLNTATLEPGAGINRKRHGVTRGRPPREHLKGLPSPIGPLEAATPADGNRGLCYLASAGSRSPTTRNRTRTRRIAKAIESSINPDATSRQADRATRGDRVHDRHPHRT